MSVVPEKRYLFEVPSVAFCALDIAEAREKSEREERGYLVSNAMIIATPDGQLAHT